MRFRPGQRNRLLDRLPENEASRRLRPAWIRVPVGPGPAGRRDSFRRLGRGSGWGVHPMDADSVHRPCWSWSSPCDAREVGFVFSDGLGRSTRGMRLGSVLPRLRRYGSSDASMRGIYTSAPGDGIGVLTPVQNAGAPPRVRPGVGEHPMAARLGAGRFRTEPCIPSPRHLGLDSTRYGLSGTGWGVFSPR